MLVLRGCLGSAQDSPGCNLHHPLHPPPSPVSLVENCEKHLALLDELWLVYLLGAGSEAQNWTFKLTNSESSFSRVFLCNKESGYGQLPKSSVPCASVLMFTLSESHGGLFTSSISSVFQRGRGPKGVHTLDLSSFLWAQPSPLH